MLRLRTLTPAASGLRSVPGPGEVHLWRQDHRDGDDPTPVAEALALLSADERARAAQLGEGRRRLQFVGGRALCRQALSQYADVAPHEWRFAVGERGKPTVAAPVLPTPLWFSMSHCDLISICAITGSGPYIGVDIERLDRGDDGFAIAEQFFPEAEVSDLRRLPDRMRAEAFVQHWVLKESLAKALECSLADVIAGSVFELSGPDVVRASFLKPTFGSPEDWDFSLFRVDRERIGAVAMTSVRVP